MLAIAIEIPHRLQRRCSLPVLASMIALPLELLRRLEMLSNRLQMLDFNDFWMLHRVMAHFEMVFFQVAALAIKML
jgi:hypothetical protein